MTSQTETPPFTKPVVERGAAPDLSQTSKTDAVARHADGRVDIAGSCMRGEITNLALAEALVMERRALEARSAALPPQGGGVAWRWRRRDGQSPWEASARCLEGDLSAYEVQALGVLAASPAGQELREKVETALALGCSVNVILGPPSGFDDTAMVQAALDACAILSALQSADEPQTPNHEEGRS